MESIQVKELEKSAAKQKEKLIDENEANLQQIKFEKMVEDDIESRTLQLFFLRMSSIGKVELLFRMFLESKSPKSLAEILNVFFAVNTKLIFYTQVSLVSNSTYDLYINDHNRMLHPETLEKCIENSMIWFNGLDIHQQTIIMMGLMRLSGGNIIRKMYWSLAKIYYKKKQEGKVTDYESCMNANFSDGADEKLFVLEEYVPEFPGSDENFSFDPDSAMHKKVLEGRKQLQTSLARLRGNLEAEIQTLNEPILLKKRENERANSERSRRSPGKKSRSNPDEIDWVQLLPIWIVKKIFAYLDEKELQKLKNVNGYWAAVSKSLMAEIKARINLDSAIKKTRESMDALLDISPGTEGELKIEKYEKKTAAWKKQENLWKTGVAKKLKRDTAEVRDCDIGDFSLLYENLRLPILLRIRPFPMSRQAAARVETPAKIQIEDKHSEYTEGSSSVNYPVARAPAIVVSMDDLISW